MNDHLENIRRMAERGLIYATEEGQADWDNNIIDAFQHILDEYERAKKEATNENME